mmetsp:Transcript_1643/g.7190  ORF Transcript_1643/g.7190 Transcript_1643/m.7190 type:complete len:297 (-) Transcript_1643:1088-1978(-)
MHQAHARPRAQPQNLLHWFFLQLKSPHPPGIGESNPIYCHSLSAILNKLVHRLTTAVVHAPLLLLQRPHLNLVFGATWYCTITVAALARVQAQKLHNPAARHAGWIFALEVVRQKLSHFHAVGALALSIWARRRVRKQLHVKLHASLALLAHLLVVCFPLERMLVVVLASLVADLTELHILAYGALPTIIGADFHAAAATLRQELLDMRIVQVVQHQHRRVLRPPQLVKLIVIHLAEIEELLPGVDDIVADVKVWVERGIRLLVPRRVGRHLPSDVFQRADLHVVETPSLLREDAG